MTKKYCSNQTIISNFIFFIYVYPKLLRISRRKSVETANEARQEEQKVIVQTPDLKFLSFVETYRTIIKFRIYFVGGTLETNTVCYNTSLCLFL